VSILTGNFSTAAMTIQDSKRPDNLAECHALLDAHLQHMRWLEARLKRLQRKRKRRAQELYRSHCQGMAQNARKHDAGREPKRMA
jgi:hypothetical protein